MCAARLSGAVPAGDWKLGGFVCANLYDQRALLGAEIARHPLSILWLAANVKKPELPRAVHEWVAHVAWTRAPPTRPLIQFVGELRDTIYREIPQGQRIAELARLDEVLAATGAAVDDGAAAVVAAYRARAGAVYWATDVDVLGLIVLRALGAAPRADALWCRRGGAAPLALADWLVVVGETRRWSWCSTAWPPLRRWRVAMGLPRGTLAQYATMARPDWAEAWTRAGWPCNRSVARLGAAWRSSPGVVCGREAEQFIGGAAY